MTLRRLLAPALLFVCLPLLSVGVSAQGARARAAAEIESLREQIKAKEALLLAPSREDYRAHAEFLSQPGAGLIRLMPREDWEGKLTARGGGAYYSFARLDHEYGFATSIGFEQGHLRAGFGGADFGFLVNLGDVPLANVTAEAEGVKYLADFAPPGREPEAREQQRRTSAGFEVGGVRYRNRLAASVNDTYALRSISYGSADVLVAFRVVRKDSDGSVIILWKMLKEFPKPSLERNVEAGGAR